MEGSLKASNEIFSTSDKWADMEIRAYPRDILRKYTRSYVHCENVLVNPKKIIGTDHPKYIGISWRDFFCKGQRISERMKSLSVNPGYYGECHQENSRYGGWSLVQVHGVFFIVDGNHRSIIAKRLAHHGIIQKQLIPDIVKYKLTAVGNINFIFWRFFGS